MIEDAFALLRDRPTGEADDTRWNRMLVSRAAYGFDFLKPPAEGITSCTFTMECFSLSLGLTRTDHFFTKKMPKWEFYA